MSSKDVSRLTFVDPELYGAHCEARGKTRNSIGANRKRKSEGQNRKKGKKSKASTKLAEDMCRSSYRVLEDEKYSKSRWICCNSCKKWRRVGCALPFESLAGWKCSDNEDEKHKSCDIGEEETEENEVVVNGLQHKIAYSHEKREFCAHLNEFLEQNGFPATKKPMLGGKELDLYRTYREVIYRGGYRAVVKKPGTWSQIFRSLENSDNGKVTDASYRLKWYYIENLFAYEQHYFHGLDAKSISVPQKPKRVPKGQSMAAKDAMAAKVWQLAQLNASQWGQKTTGVRKNSSNASTWYSTAKA